jgi:hypothetical protein
MVDSRQDFGQGISTAAKTNNMLRGKMQIVFIASISPLVDAAVAVTGTWSFQRLQTSGLRSQVCLRAFANLDVDFSIKGIAFNDGCISVRQRERIQTVRSFQSNFVDDLFLALHSFLSLASGNNFKLSFRHLESPPDEVTHQTAKNVTAVLVQPLAPCCIKLCKQLFRRRTLKPFQ